MHYEGACWNSHGHTYTLEATVEGPLGTKSMLMDFKVLKSIIGEVKDILDHATILNEKDEEHIEFYTKLKEKIHLTHHDPTAEVIATAIYSFIAHKIKIRYKKLRLYKIKLWETPTSFVEVYEDDIY